MPIYEYHCDECEKNFDVFVRSAAQQSQPKCPECGSTKVKKAISLFGVGSGGGAQSLGASCGPGPI